MSAGRGPNAASAWGEIAAKAAHFRAHSVARASLAFVLGRFAPPDGGLPAGRGAAAS
jgi:hypothetical protein